MEGFKIFSDKGPFPFPKGEKNQNKENSWKIFTSSSPEPLRKFQPNLALSILGEVNSTLFK